MSDIDWNAKAVVHQRADGGSELDYNFDKVGEGTLAEMVRWVSAMPSADRARIIFDVSGKGNLDIGQVIALAARPDLPG